MGIDFKQETQTARFYSPLEDFEETTVQVEIREDPLTNRQTRIVPDAFVEPESESELDDTVTDADGCFFCPDKVGEMTPEYPDFVGFDRGSIGEATSFPNLNPYGSHSNVVVLTEDHYVPIDELTRDLFADGLEAALDYVHAVFDAEESSAVASVNMNFLPTAGSSIVHPHIQTLVDDRGTNLQQDRIEGAKAYLTETGTNYFEDLLAVTRDTDRFVGSTGEIEWFTPFAPLHHRHVRGVVTGSEPLSPGSSAVDELATGITNVLTQYAAAGLNSFNFGLHIFKDKPLQPHIDVVARSVFQEYAWSDATFFETIHGEGVIDISPAEYASDLAEQF